VTDWSSYDNIAGRYDDVWGSRFETVARLVRERVPLSPGSSVLDIGTGTGIVLRAFASQVPQGSRLTGCDRSTAMIRVARSRVPALRFVAADAMSLPFQDATFDVATASFVLSHFVNHEAGLREARRVLKPGGAFALTSWAADTNEHSEAWRELLAGVISKGLLQEAVARVVPGESRFESAANVQGALTAAGFSNVEVQGRTLSYTIQLDRFLDERELSVGGRFVRHTLGAEPWARFRACASEELGRRFGSVLECSRGVLIGLGERAE
jgi:ubiquinone/menaquinone biosynthesis C-methylase UbiE